MANQNVTGTANVNANTGADNEVEKKIPLADLMLFTMLDRAEMLDSQIRQQANIVKSQNENIKQLNKIFSKLANHTQETKTVSKPTWQVDHDKSPKEIQLDGGNKILIHGNNEAWSIVDSNGNSTKIWGDPHVSEGDAAKHWDFIDDSTFVLEDGTKITVTLETDPGGRSGIYTEGLTITKANQSIEVTGIAYNDPQIGNPMLDGGAKDILQSDGHIFEMGDQADDWVYSGSELQAGDRIEGKIDNELMSSVTKDSNVKSVLTESDIALLKELGVEVYDSSGQGLLTPSEIRNIQTQIKDTRDSISSISNLDLTKLDSYSKKYTQSIDLASQFMKSQFDQARSVIRNIN